MQDQMMMVNLEALTLAVVRKYELAGSERDGSLKPGTDKVARQASAARERSQY